MSVLVPALTNAVPALISQDVLGSEVALHRLLIAIAVLLVVVLVGRFVMAVAWKLLLVAGAVVGGLYVLSLASL